MFTLTCQDRHGIIVHSLQPRSVETVTGVRRLTPLECERLQGFPDGWTKGISDTQRYRCLGNAVSVPVVRAIGERLIKGWISN